MRQSVKRKRGFNKSSIAVLIMAMIGLVYLAVFSYVPMFGILLGFKNGDYLYSFWDALGSEWVGFDQFARFLSDMDFKAVFWNTLGLNTVCLLINFPAPILFAVLINEVVSTKLKRTLQSITYLPHFLSWVVFGTIILALVNTNNGIVNMVLQNFGIVDNPVNFQREHFWGLVIFSSVIKGVGWGSIIYLAAITSIDPQLYEAAEIDGAGRLRCILHVTLPSIAPTITMFLLLSISGILGNGIEQMLILQDGTITNEVFDTYVLHQAFGGFDGSPHYSYATALGLFRSVIAMLLLLVSNALSKLFTGKGVF